VGLNLSANSKSQFLSCATVAFSERYSLYVAAVTSRQLAISFMNFRLIANGGWNLLLGKWSSVNEAMSVRRECRVGDTGRCVKCL